MNGQPEDVERTPIDPDVNQAEIEELIAQNLRAGATHCEVVTENGQRFLVCRWPPP